MDEEPQDSADERPKIFKNINAWLGGITGVVLALAGLRLAWQQLMPAAPVKPAAEMQGEAPPTDAGQAAKPAAAADAQALRPSLYKGDLYADGAYTGGSIRLEHVGERWVLTAGDVRYDYDEMASQDKSKIAAVSTEYASWLRWPIQGGEVEESTSSKKDAWETYARVEPSSPRPAN